MPLAAPASGAAGGTAVGAPDAGGVCSSAAECASAVCRDGACAAATCSDAALNQDEVDVDCGGRCGACAEGARCSQPSDCSTGVCDAFGCAEGLELCCQPPLCSDGNRNGTESGVDCGGTDPGCARCAVGLECNVDADCASGVCTVQGCEQGIASCCQPSALDAAAACAASAGTLVDSNSCLIFVPEARVSWPAASLGCQSRNAALVSIKTLARDELISALIDTDIWIGAFDPGSDPAANAFVWRDQSAVDTTFSTWADGEPDAVAGQFCVTKSPPTFDGQWRDAPCDELKAYVCEQTL